MGPAVITDFQFDTRPTTKNARALRPRCSQQHRRNEEVDWAENHLDAMLEQSYCDRDSSDLQFPLGEH